MQIDPVTLVADSLGLSTNSILISFTKVPINKSSCKVASSKSDCKILV